MWKKEEKIFLISQNFYSFYSPLFTNYFLGFFFPELSQIILSLSMFVLFNHKDPKREIREIVIWFNNTSRTVKINQDCLNI